MISREDFNRYISQALANLFDFVQLEQNPLCAALPDALRAGNASPGRALQHALLQGIEALKPEGSISPSAVPWRTYHLLHMRYVEGLMIKEIMNVLQLGDRQLRRENLRGVAALSSLLWDEWFTGAPAPQPETQAAFPVSAAPVHLDEIFITILNTLKSMPGSNWQNISLHLPPDLPLVQSDRVLLRQALITSLYRYLVHHPERLMTITCQRRPQDLVITLRGSHDSIGWETDEFHRLVNLFQQVDNQLQIENSMVTLKIPVVDTHKILMIDDDEATIHLFKRYLTGLPYTLIPAQDSSAVAPLAVQIQPDLILLDVLLPNVDGWEVLQQLKADPRIGRIPVIICSAWNEPEIAFSLGASGFLHKNVLRSDLIDMLQRTLAPNVRT